MGFLTRYDAKLSEPLLGHPGSRVSIQPCLLVLDAAPQLLPEGNEPRSAALTWVVPRVLEPSVLWLFLGKSGLEAASLE